MFYIEVNDREYHVYFEHAPQAKHEKGTGVTECRVIEGENVLIADALCSKSDQYDKNRGRKVSLARALGVLGFTRAERTLFWKMYFEKRGKVN